MSKFMKIFIALLIVVGCSKQNDNKNVDYNLTIESANGQSTNLVVENAVTPEELQNGLMDRKNLPEGTGMIFNLKGIPQVAMWMKNTLIPLDMVFVNDGKVVWLYENAKPNSTEIIQPPVPTNAVIELNAGDIKKLGIKEGDVVKHAFFTETVENAPDTTVVEETISAEGVNDSDKAAE